MTYASGYKKFVELRIIIWFKSKSLSFPQVFQLRCIFPCELMILKLPWQKHINLSFLNQQLCEGSFRPLFNLYNFQLLNFRWISYNQSNFHLFTDHKNSIISIFHVKINEPPVMFQNILSAAEWSLQLKHPEWLR